ncbi:TPA: hypothetical protein ACX6RO_001777 [Photobacterium damselae]
METNNKKPRFSWRKDKAPSGLAAVTWKCTNVSLYYGKERLAVVSFRDNIYWYSLLNKTVIDGVTINCPTRNTGGEQISYDSIDDAKKACKQWIVEQIKLTAK